MPYTEVTVTANVAPLKAVAGYGVFKFLIDEADLENTKKTLTAILTKAKSTKQVNDIRVSYVRVDDMEAKKNEWREEPQ